jgi:hypothetical protein
MLATAVGNAAFISAHDNAPQREGRPGFPLSQSPRAIRTYRILFRDARSVLGHSHEADLGSDEEARQLAARMLNAQTASTLLRFGTGHGSFALCVAASKRGRSR